MRIFKKLLLLSILIISTVRGEENPDQEIVSDNKIIGGDLKKGLDIQKEGTVTVCEDITVTNEGETAIKDGLYKYEIDDRYYYRYLGQDIEVQTGGNLIGEGTIEGPVIRHHAGKAPEWKKKTGEKTYNISLDNITNHGNISADLTLDDATDKFFEVIDMNYDDYLARMYRDILVEYDEGAKYEPKITIIDRETPTIYLCDITKSTDIKKSLKNSLGSFEISEQGKDGKTTTYKAYGKQDGQDIGQIALTIDYNGSNVYPYVYPFSTFKINIKDDEQAAQNAVLKEISSTIKDNGLKRTLDSICSTEEQIAETNDTDELAKLEKELAGYNEQYKDITEQITKMESCFQTLEEFKAKENSYDEKAIEVRSIAGVYTLDEQLVVPEGTEWNYEKITEVLNIEIAGYEKVIEDMEKLGEYYKKLTADENPTQIINIQLDVLNSHFSDGMDTSYKSGLENTLKELSSSETWDEDKIYANISDYTTHLGNGKFIYTQLIDEMSSFIYNDGEAVIVGTLYNNSGDGIDNLQIITGSNKILYLNGGINFVSRNAGLIIGDTDPTYKGDNYDMAYCGNVVIGENAAFRYVTNVDLYPSLENTDDYDEGTTRIHAISGSTLVFQEGDKITTDGDWTFRDNSRLISKRRITVSSGKRITFGAPYAKTIEPDKIEFLQPLDG